MVKMFYTDGTQSRHDSLEGMVEMLLLELDHDDYLIQSNSYSQGWSEKEKVDFLEMFDVRVES